MEGEEGRRAAAGAEAAGKEGLWHCSIWIDGVERESILAAKKMEEGGVK